MQTSGWYGNNWAGGRKGEVGNTHFGGTENSRDGNKMLQVGTVDGGKRDRGREGVGKSRSDTKYIQDSRSRPDPLPTRPLPRVPLLNTV